MRINFCIVKVDERKGCQKRSGSELKQKHEDRISLYADDGSEVAGKLNTILGTNK